MDKTDGQRNLPRLEPFKAWQSLESVEQLFWKTSNQLEKEAGGHYARYANRPHAKLRGEILTTVQFAKYLSALPKSWDMSIELRFCLDDGKNSSFEYDAEYRWTLFQPRFGTSKPGWIEVTRCAVSVLADKERDKAWSNVKTPADHEKLTQVNNSSDWPILKRSIQQAVDNKLRKNRYPENTALLLYVDCDESVNAINWIQNHEPDFFPSLCRKIDGKFSHLFAWGPSAGVFYEELTSQ